MKELTISIPDEYPQIVLAAIIICIEVHLISMIFVPISRTYNFNNKFLKSNFGEIHKNSGVKSRIEYSLGLPDNGNGFYGQKLDYPSWVNLNNMMRVH